jgi:hypothetical protein
MRERNAFSLTKIIRSQGGGESVADKEQSTAKIHLNVHPNLYNPRVVSHIHAHGCVFLHVVISPRQLCISSRARPRFRFAAPEDPSQPTEIPVIVSLEHSTPFEGKAPPVHRWRARLPLSNLHPRERRVRPPSLQSSTP